MFWSRTPRTPPIHRINEDPPPNVDVSIWEIRDQHNPYGWDHSRNDFNKTWGHAVSTDLVHWEELPGTIHPDHLGTIYSGSAVVDENNTTGFQTGEEKPIVAVYTSAGGRSPWSDGVLFSQSIAYSNDRGRTYTPYDGNPVLPNIEYINRDPKVIWHEPTNQWVIVVHFNGRAMAFFTSKDLKTWEKQSELEIPFEDCPELFQLAIDGDEENKKWVLYGGRGAYVLGDFDGKTYTPETKPVRYSYGNCFYASQTFSNIPDEDGRRIQMGWGVIPMEGMPFNQQMLFPVELTLRTTEDGLRMFSYPVQEIESIRGGNSRMFEATIGPNETKEVAPQGELFDIVAEFEVGKADAFGLIVNGIPVTYTVASGELSCAGMKATLKPEDGKIRLRILVDRVSMEIFGNDGRLYMPVRALDQENGEGVAVFSKGERQR